MLTWWWHHQSYYTSYTNKLKLHNKTALKVYQLLLICIHCDHVIYISLVGTEKVNFGQWLMLSRLSSWLWMKPKNTDITGRDETQEHRYNRLTMCSTCPGSCTPSLITTGQCQRHSQSKIGGIHRLITVCLEGHGSVIFSSLTVIMQTETPASAIVFFQLKVVLYFTLWRRHVKWFTSGI